MLIALVITCFVIAAIFGLLWLLSGNDAARVSRAYEPEIINESKTMKDTSIPNEWEPYVIEQKITSLVNSNNLALLDHFVESVKKRLIMRQDDRTAKISTQFMRSLIERLGVVKQLRTAYEDLRLYEKELDIRVTKLDTEQLEQELKLGDLKHQKEIQDRLNALKLKEKELEHERRVAEMERDINDIRNPPKPPPPPPPKPSEEEVRAKRKQEIWQRMASRKQEKQQKIDELTECKPLEECSEDVQQQVRRLENLYDSADERDTEELGKYL